MKKVLRVTATILGSIFLSFLISALLSHGRLELKEIIALFAFFTVIFGTILLWSYKVAIAGLSLSLLVIFKVFTVWEVFHYIDPILILSLIGLMVTFEFMDRSGFLPWLSYKVTRLGLEDPRRVMLGIFLFSAFMGAIADELTTIIFLLSLVAVISREEGYDPRYLALSSVFGVNIGSAATLIGSPVGIYLGAHAYPSGLSFTDFLAHSAPNVLLVLLFSSIFLYFTLGKRIEETKLDLPEERVFEYELEVIEAEMEETEVENWETLHNPRNFYLSFSLFVLLIFGLILQRPIELALGIVKGSMIALLPIITASLSLIASRAEEVRDILEKGVNWWLILYLAFAMPVISSIAVTGILDRAVEPLSSLGRSLPYVTLGLSAGMSAWADNFPVVVMLTPLYSKVVEVTGCYGLWWPLLFGACFGGNISPVGSVANLVATGDVERTWGERIPVKEWLKYGSGVALVSLGVSAFWIFLQGL